jgi:hypothetical protein
MPNPLHNPLVLARREFTLSMRYHTDKTPEQLWFCRLCGVNKKGEGFAVLIPASWWHQDVGKWLLQHLYTFHAITPNDLQSWAEAEDEARWGLGGETAR